MARPYIPNPHEIAPAYPAATFEPWPVLDRRTDHPQRTETFTWPGAANNYTIRLDFAILEQLLLKIEGAGDELLAVRWTDTPGPGEVAVHHGAGLLRCNPALAEESGSCTYTPLGSVVDAQWQNTIQKELAAAQSTIVQPSKKHYHFDSPTTIPNDADVVTIEGMFEDVYYLPSVQDYPLKSLIIGMLTGTDVFLYCQPGETMVHVGGTQADMPMQGGSARTLVGVPSKNLWLICHAD